MKNIRRISAILLALVMVLALTVNAFAYTVTIEPNADDNAAHTYEAYQIFKGDLAESNNKKILSNITWGSNVDDTKLGQLAADIEALRDPTAENYTALTASSSAAEFAEAIAALNAGNDTETAQKVADAHGLVMGEGVAGLVIRLRLGFVVCADVQVFDLVDGVGRRVLVDGLPVDMEDVLQLAVRRDHVAAGVHQILDDRDGHRAGAGFAGDAQGEVHAAVGVVEVVARRAVDVSLPPVSRRLVAHHPDGGAFVPGIPVVEAGRQGDGGADLLRVRVLCDVVPALQGGQALPL